MRLCWVRALALVMLFTLALTSVKAQPAGGETAASAAGVTVFSVAIDGPIGPATSRYVRDQLAAAAQAGAAFVILRIDTPGGLSTATREIVQAILASPVPVVSFVAPRGARAASAGTYILYASHIAAMAPATHLGAATPVTMGGGAAAPEPDNNGDSADDAPASNQTAERRKLVNDAVAYIRSLAEQRQRNADWAEAAVREGASLTAERALEMNVIDLMAANRPRLLAEIDGMTVETATGPVSLNTGSVTIVEKQPGWRTQLLGVITQPTVAYLLLMIGIFGLLLEGLNPGAVLPGVIGGICLLVALYAFQVLPVNYAGLGLIALGIALMIGEMFAPSFGALGLGGVAAFAFGSVMLMDTDVAGFQIPLGLIGGLSIASALLMFLIIGMFFRSRRKRVHTGSQGLVGSRCVAQHDFDNEGRVWLHGESWLAHSDVPVRRNDTLEVVSAQGLTVRVRPATDVRRPTAHTPNN